MTLVRRLARAATGRAGRTYRLVATRTGSGGESSPYTLQVAVDPVLLEETQQALEVLDPQAGQAGRLAAPEVRNRQPVGMVDGLARHSGVPAAGPVRGDPLLQDHDLQLRIEPLEEDRRPQPGEPGADDRDFGLAAPDERRIRFPPPPGARGPVPS